MKYAVTMTVHAMGHDDAVGIAKLALTSLVLEDYASVTIVPLDEDGDSDQ